MIAIRWDMVQAKEEGIPCFAFHTQDIRRNKEDENSRENSRGIGVECSKAYYKSDT